MESGTGAKAPWRAFAAAQQKFRAECRRFQ